MSESGKGEVAYAVICPHAGVSIPRSGRDEDAADARQIQQALLEQAKRLAASDAESVVLFTPHNVHVEGTFAVIDADKMHGSLRDGGAGSIQMKATVDRDLALGIQKAVREKGLPMLRINAGSNEPGHTDHHMDWGTLIPLWYLGGRDESPRPITVIVPCRDLSAADHVRLGEAIADAIRASGKKVAVIASADQAHGHDETGPYRQSDESGPFDDQVMEILRSDKMEKLPEMDLPLVRAAFADSWWQMLILHGVLGKAWKPEEPVYERLTYFGMIVCQFTPREPGTSSANNTRRTSAGSHR